MTSLDKSTNSTLQKIIDEIEEKSPGLSVVAASPCCYSFTQTLATVKISESRRLTVLEEIILRAGLELNPTPTEAELGKVLGLDNLFINSVTAKLKNLEMLENTEDLTIKLTTIGKQFYQKGYIPQKAKTEEIYSIFNPLTGNITFSISPYEKKKTEDINNLFEFIIAEPKTIDLSALSLIDIQDLTRESGLTLHIPENDKFISSFTFDTDSEIINDVIYVLFIYDIIENNYSFIVKNNTKLLTNFSNLLTSLYLDDKIDIEKLFKLSSKELDSKKRNIIEQKNQEVEERLNQIRNQVVAFAKNSRENPSVKEKVSLKNPYNIVLLRDRFIRQVFLDTLKSAQNYVIIYSPWISEKVIDNEFIQILKNLVKKDVSILIGHGISRYENQENREISPNLIAELQSIKTPEGLPGIQLVWLGNSHAKEVIVDGKIHLCGSHNWLSYRGDKFPRGETVYKVTIPDQVKQAYNYYAEKFTNHTNEKWKYAIEKKDLALAVDILCIWDTLHIEENIIIEKIAQANYVALIPYWLKLIRKKLRLKSIRLESLCLNNTFLLISSFGEVNKNHNLVKEEYSLLLNSIPSHKRKELIIKLAEN
ncbi:hypothetical protein [Cyanobacterium sp. HL-69]|uniref:hypothetical protein n=1 Tax=Cyanobacterium sp. HL-69 TaxID=2054282 RepID=UPI00406BBCBC